MLRIDRHGRTGLRTMLVATLVIATGVVAPARAEAPAVTALTDAPAPAMDRTRLNARVFDRVWEETRRNYYDPGLNGVDWNAARERYRPEAIAARDERSLYVVLRTMMRLLDDDHAGVSQPSAVRRREAMRQRRAVMGLTLFAEDDGVWRVDQVRAGSPAQEAGVELGWRLQRIDGRPWGPEIEVTEGLPVLLDMTDAAGQARAVSVLPREMDPAPPFSIDRSRDGAAVIRVESFEAGLGRWMGRQLAALPAGTDVILDLRANPGGRLTEADAVLSCFLKASQPWAQRTGRTGRRVVLRTSGGCGGGAPYAMDVAVLIDKASRSAAELTPAALQEARRATVIGERSAGAVLISQDQSLPDGGQLTLSRADFVTTGGVRLEKRGVTPDILAVRTLEDRRAGRDPALDAALAALRAN